MTWGEWQISYKNLCATYGHKPMGDQCATYFEVLSAFPNDVVDSAVVRVARDQKHWPKVAELFDAARGAARGQAAPAPECATCHGSGFVDMPDQTHFGLIYMNYVAKCPSCRPAKASAA